MIAPCIYQCIHRNKIYDVLEIMMIYYAAIGWMPIALLPNNTLLGSNELYYVSHMTGCVTINRAATYSKDGVDMSESN